MEITRPSSSFENTSVSQRPNEIKQNVRSEITRQPLINRNHKKDFDLEDLYCVLQLESNNSLIAIELASRLKSMGRLNEAHRILSRVVTIDYRFETMGALGLLEYEMDQSDEAFVHLQDAIVIAPESHPGLFDIFKALGNICVRRGDFELAEDNYHKAHRLNPDNDVLWVNLGTLSIQRSNWDEALIRFRKAVGLNATNDKAWVGLALCHRIKGDWELAWGNIEASLEYNPLNETALGLAVEWSTMEGKESRVLELIRNFLVEGGWNERMSLSFAWLSWKRGDRRLATLELERLLAVNPHNSQALNLVNQIRNEA